jgi:hypothetical protein
VRHIEGTVHGFLAVRSKEGRALAVGDLFQVVHGDRVASRLVFHFKDGSVDDDTTVFSQHGNFQLITDHHIQKGPSFPQPMDLSIDVPRGQVTVRSTGKDGKEKIESEHLDLPPDLVNGLILSISKNILPETPETKVSMVVLAPKPRLVKVAISPQGEEPFSLVGSQRKAMRYVMKIELGGIAGMVAPLIGKAPPEIQILDHRRASSGIRERRRPALSGWSRLDHPTDKPRLARFTSIWFLELPCWTSQ